MSEATSGIGTKFQRWANAQWEDLAEVNSITGPGKSRETIDCTSLASLAGYREFIGGLRNPGTVQFSMNFIRRDYDKLNADFESDVLGNYRICLPDDEESNFEFEGLVTELPLNIPPDDKITCDVTIQVSGQVHEDSGDSSGQHTF